MLLCHAAPEVLTSARYDAKLADIWSAGVMLYTMLCCSYPFEKKEDDPKDLRTQTKIMQRIMRGDSPLPERSLMAAAPSLSMSATNLISITQCETILHRRVKDYTPNTDSNARHLVSPYPLLLQQTPSTCPGSGLSVAGHALSILCNSAGQQLVLHLMHVPCSGVRVALVAPDQHGVQGPPQQGAGGRSQAANGNPGHPGVLLPRAVWTSHGIEPSQPGKSTVAILSWVSARI